MLMSRVNIEVDTKDMVLGGTYFTRISSMFEDGMILVGTRY